MKMVLREHKYDKKNMAIVTFNEKKARMQVYM